MRVNCASGQRITLNQRRFLIIPSVTDQSGDFMATLEDIRCQFPVTTESFTTGDGVSRSITYLDHGASTHPPRPVLDRYRDFLEHFYANIHRGNHYLSRKASELYDGVSGVVHRFVGSDPAANGVIFTSNTTTALDIAAYLMADVPGDTLVSVMEHHSNDLPHRRRGGTRRIEILADGTLDYDDLERKLTAGGVKMVALTGASNVTGYMPDLRRVARLAHTHGAKLLVDGAQLLAHHAVDMLPNEHPEHIDFFAAAGHKAYAPFGSAFLIAPMELSDHMTPYIPGGGTVKFVTDTGCVWATGSDRHSGGTPNIPGVIGLGAALEWLAAIGLDWIREHEVALLQRVEGRLRAIEGVSFLGDIPAARKLGVLVFNIAGIHHDDVASVLNNEFGIATRNGCFCAHPYLSRLLHCTDVEGVRRAVEAGDDVALPGAVRATIGVYNNDLDLDKLVDAVSNVAANSERFASAVSTNGNACLETITPA